MLNIEEDDRTITVSDAREFFGGCIPGWQLFAELNGFIWVDVVRHGLKASQLLATEDIMAIDLVTFVYNKPIEDITNE